MNCDHISCMANERKLWSATIERELTDIDYWPFNL